MNNTKLTAKEVVNLVYGSEDDKLAEKVVIIYNEQQKKSWIEDCYNKQADLASQQLRDLEESNKE